MQASLIYLLITAEQRANMRPDLTSQCEVAGPVGEVKSATQR